MTSLRHSQRRRRLMFIAASLISVLVIILLSNADLDGYLRLSDRIAFFPTAESQYRQIVARVFAAATYDMMLLSEEIPFTLVRDVYSGCIDGSVFRIYGTNRPFKDVLTGYDKILSDMDWEREIDDDYLGFFIPNAKVIILPVRSSNLMPHPAGAEKYETVYSVFIQYADPEIARCQG